MRYALRPRCGRGTRRGGFDAGVGFGVISALDIDGLCESVLRQVTGPQATTGSAAVAAGLVAELARRHPQAPALTAVLPLALAAAALDEMLGGEADRRAARDLWRAAALVAAEVLALQTEAAPEAPPPAAAALAARLGGGGAPA